jgi:hypothetical protein
MIRYNFHIENFTRYLVTRTVDSDVLESSLYIMKTCPVMYTGLRQLWLFTTPIRLLIDPYYKTPATTSTRFHTHPPTSRYNFIPHSSLHIPLQIHSSLISTYPATNSLLTHPYIFRCNFTPHPFQYTPLQLHSSLIPTYPAATLLLTHPYISRCNCIPHPFQYTPLQLHPSLIPTYPAATAFLTHSNIPRCNFIPHRSLHIPLQLYSSPIPTYPTATSFLSHPYIVRCNFNSFHILENNCAVSVALLRCMR